MRIHLIPLVPLCYSSDVVSSSKVSVFRIGYNIGYGRGKTKSAVFRFEAALIFMQSNSCLSVSVFFRYTYNARD